MCVRSKPHPLSVRSEVARAWSIRWEDDLGSGNDVFGTVLASASGGQAASSGPHIPFGKS